jgi:hypothetical protein
MIWITHIIVEIAQRIEEWMTLYLVDSHIVG